MPNMTESKNELLKSDDLCRTSETAPSNPRSSIEPRLRTIALICKDYNQYKGRENTFAVEDWIEPQCSWRVLQNTGLDDGA